MEQTYTCMKIIYSYLLLTLFLFIACSKKNNGSNTPPEKTKTDFLVASSWKFEKATASGVGDVSAQFSACVKDNILSFTATAAKSGSGIIDEGASKCNDADPQTMAFTWTLTANDTQLVTSKALFEGGSTEFTIVTLTATSFVVEQTLTIAPYPATTVTLYLKH